MESEPSPPHLNLPGPGKVWEGRRVIEESYKYLRATEGNRREKKLKVREEEGYIEERKETEEKDLMEGEKVTWEYRKRRRERRVQESEGKREKRSIEKT